MADRSTITGGAGAVPPPHAPREVTTPGSERATAEQIAKARANERSLAPLTFDSPALSDPLPAPPPRKAKAMPPPIVQFAGPVIVLTDQMSLNDQAKGAVDPPEAFAHAPAASASESPSRGVPRGVDDPGKQITGGFGDVGEAQYFPLDGSELREVVYGLLEQIHARLKDDLRFTMAATYPRVSAKVVVEIQGYGIADPILIPAVAPPHTTTPLAVAQERADDICFVVQAIHREMTEDGESVTPPDQARLNRKLPVPRKQSVPTPSGGRMVVDIRS